MQAAGFLIKMHIYIRLTPNEAIIMEKECKLKVMIKISKRAQVDHLRKYQSIYLSLFLLNPLQYFA